MTIVLVKFWLRRFAIVFAIACAALALLERLQHGDNPSYLSAVGWAGAAGLVAASIATYWAYKHSCAISRESP
jgi:hypothetical protein